MAKGVGQNINLVIGQLFCDQNLKTTLWAIFLMTLKFVL